MQNCITLSTVLEAVELSYITKCLFGGEARRTLNNNKPREQERARVEAGNVGGMGEG